jgi:anti-sigma-K factor RskA
MMDEQDHAQDLVGAYVLGAVTPDEAALVEEHLQSCASCRQLERDLREVEQRLPEWAGELTPPPQLKARVMAIVEQEAAARADHHGTEPATQPDGHTPPAPVDMRGRAPGRRLARWSPLLAVAAVLVVAVVGFATWRALTGGSNGSHQYAISGTAALPTAKGTLTYDRRTHTLQLDLHGLRALPPSRVYELWLVRVKGTAIVGFHGVGVFRPNVNGRGQLTVSYPTTKPYNLAGVTVERAPGSATPTFPIVAKGPIS